MRMLHAKSVPCLRREGTFIVVTNIGFAGYSETKRDKSFGINMKYLIAAFISFAAFAADVGAQIPSSASPAPPPKTSDSSSSKDGTSAFSRYVKKDTPARISRFETPPVIDGK